jgi:hypothetical protein
LMNLGLFTIALHCSRPREFRLHIDFRSSTSESSHLIAGLPIHRVLLVCVEITSCKGSAATF